MGKAQTSATTTFGQRFEFSRDRQRGLGIWQNDQTLAKLADVSGGQITEYKARQDAPPARRTLLLAQVMAVDPGWLAFGEHSAAPEPEGFRLWLERRGPELNVQHVNPANVQAAPRKKNARKGKGSK